MFIGREAELQFSIHRLGEGVSRNPGSAIWSKKTVANNR